ncbi:MAG: hypothetical protein JXB50_14480, partial [Spirochaetes bacterium]|nr:hypothetical protein [Spirochaetota bacterium]
MEKLFQLYDLYNNFSDKKKQIISILIIFVVILLFFIPGLFQFEKLLRVDAAWQALPRMMAIARYVQNGEIPLWNQDTFMGGRPFYAMYEGPLYNLLLYPFFLIADLDNYTQSYYVLYLIPFLLYLLFGALGSYYFAKKILKLNEIGAIVMSLAFSLGPHILLYIDSFHSVCIFSLIPWVLLCGSIYLETRKLKWWLLTILFLTLSSMAYDTNIILRVYFIIALIFFFIWFLLYINRKNSFITLIGLLFIFIFSIAILGVMWAGILEGLSWFTDAKSTSYEAIISYYTSNLWPGHLITLFIPTYNGLNPGEHAWGKAIGGDQNILFLGGMTVSFFIYISIIFLIYYLRERSLLKRTLQKRKQDDDNKTSDDRLYFVWIVIGLTIFFLSILVMMGKYTPVFYLLCKMLPWIFQIPYPFYFRFAQCWGASILTGIGVTLLFRYDHIREKVFKPKLILLFFAVVLVLAVIPFFEKIDLQFLIDNTNKNLPHVKSIIDIINKNPGKYLFSYESLIYFKEIKWFILNPLFYFILFTLLFTAALLFKPYLLKNFLVAAIFFDILFFAYIAFYKNNNTGRVDDRYFYEKINMKRDGLPSENALFQLADQLNRVMDNDDCRFFSAESNRDNAAWIIRKRSAAGYDGKPLMKNIYYPLVTFMENWPYQMYATHIPVHFLKNLNIGYIVVPEGLMSTDEPEMFIQREDKNRHLLNGFLLYRLMDIDYKIDARQKITGPSHKIIKVGDPMPYIYTLDTIRVLEHVYHRFRL